MSGIEWTDETWNPTRGCSRTCAEGTWQSGCGDGTGGGCYAETMAGRIVRMGRGKPTPYDGLVRETATGWRWTGVVQFDPVKLAAPLQWRRPRRIFVNSMSDLFHESLSNEKIAAVFGVMAASPQHTFQVLTKRAKRMREWFEWVSAAIDGDTPSRFCFAFAQARGAGEQPRRVVDAARDASWPLPNVWLGVSVENQAAADDRIPELLRTPAALRFLSCEPLLGSIDIQPWTQRVSRCTEDDPCAACQRDDGVLCRMSSNPPRIDWAIAGCESGPDARTCEVDWLRSLRDQCQGAGVPFFLKQAKATYPTSKSWEDDRESPEAGGVYNTAPAPIVAAPGSLRKPGGIIGLPYLDGVQHAVFPRTR